MEKFALICVIYLMSRTRSKADGLSCLNRRWPLVLLLFLSLWVFYSFVLLLFLSKRNHRQEVIDRGCYCRENRKAFFRLLSLSFINDLGHNFCLKIYICHTKVCMKNREEEKNSGKSKKRTVFFSSKVLVSRCPLNFFLKKTLNRRGREKRKEKMMKENISHGHDSCSSSAMGLFFLLSFSCHSSFQPPSSSPSPSSSGDVIIFVSTPPSFSLFLPLSLFMIRLSSEFVHEEEDEGVEGEENGSTWDRK